MLQTFCHGQLTSPLLLLRICPKRICPKDQLVTAIYCSYCSKSGKFRLSFSAQLRYPWCCSFFKRPVKLDSMLTAHVQSNTALKEENSSIGFNTTIPCNIGFHTLYTYIEEISVRGNHDADSWLETQCKRIPYFWKHPRLRRADGYHNICNCWQSRRLTTISFCSSYLSPSLCAAGQLLSWDSSWAARWASCVEWFECRCSRRSLQTLQVPMSHFVVNFGAADGECGAEEARASMSK